MVNKLLNNRKHRRFELNNHEVNGKMVLAAEVEVIDISISGIAVKANRRLNIGSEYTLKLEASKTISIRGTLVWCSLIETRKESNGEMIPIYSAGIQFKDMSTEKITELQYLIDNHKTNELHVAGSTRLNIRFQITDPENATLSYPDNYKVKTIGLGGVCIECLQNFEIDSRIPMEMFIHDESTLKFMGRVASSKVIEKESQKQYDIGIEFLDLSEKDRELLASFIDQSAMAETETES